MEKDRAENLEETCICVWGDNTFGQLALDTTNIEQQLFMPKHVTFEIHISEISCAFEHSLLRTVEGKLYAAGNNLKGQLGIGKKIKRKTSPTLINLVDEQEKILLADAQGFHNIAYTEYGNIFVWGDNNHGQLGTGDFENKDIPFSITENLKLDNNDSITGISCGREHSCVLLTTGKVIAWGSNKHSQLGIESEGNEEINDPQPVLISNIKQVAAGYEHTLYLDNTGEVWVVGNNRNSQLNPDNEEDIINRPERIVSPEKVKRIMASNFNALVSEKDTLYIWGSFLEETLPICAPFEDDDIGSVRSNPQKNGSNLSSNYVANKSSSKLRIVSISLGNNLVVVSDDNGDCYSWGINDNGQLGQVVDENQTEFVPVELYPKKLIIFRPFETKSVYAGYNFAMILVNERSPEEMEVTSMEYMPYEQAYNDDNYAPANPDYQPVPIHREEEDEEDLIEDGNREDITNELNNQENDFDEEEDNNEREEFIDVSKTIKSKKNDKISDEMFDIFRLIVFLYENLRFNLIKIIDDNIDVDETLSEEFINLIRKQQDVIDDYLQKFNLRIDLPFELNMENLYKLQYPNSLKLIKDDINSENEIEINQEIIRQSKEKERKEFKDEIINKLKEERTKIDKRIGQLSDILKQAK